MTKTLPAFKACTFDPACLDTTTLKDCVVPLHEALQAAHAEMPIVNGVLLLYLAGRFENFVRELFEDLCDTIAGECGQFSHLPRQMRQNLTKYTAEVIANPRKYGHAENSVIAFVNIMADNLNGKPLAGVNSKCLSITTENMWPDTLNDVFSRIGGNEVWKRLGQQAAIQTFFHVDQPDQANKEAQRSLTAFMKLRNQIAHPSGELNWPDLDQTLKHIAFCEVIARSLSEVCSVWASTLGTRQSQAQPIAEDDGITPAP